MNGLWIKDNESFATLLEPLLADFESLWWYGDFQSSPIIGDWLYQSDDNWDAYEQTHFRGKRFTDRLIWKPSTLPKFAPLIFCGEWSSLTGFETEEDEVEDAIARFVDAESFRKEEQLLAIEHFASIHIDAIDEGLFYIFSPHQNWLELLHQRWPTSEFIDSSRWSRERYNRNKRSH